MLAFIQDKSRYIDTIIQHLKGFLVLEVIWEHDENSEVIVKTDELENLIKNKLAIRFRIPIKTRAGVKMEILFLQKEI